MCNWTFEYPVSATLLAALCFLHQAYTVPTKPHSSTYRQYCASAAYLTNAMCKAVAFVRYIKLSAVQHDLELIIRTLMCHVASLLLNAGVNLGKSYLEACKLAITPSGQLIQRISDTLWQISLRWHRKENTEINKHVTLATVATVLCLARHFVTSNGPHLHTSNHECVCVIINLRLQMQHTVQVSTTARS